MNARRAVLPVLIASLLARSAEAETGKVLVFPVTGTIPNDPGDGLAQLTQLVARSAALSGRAVTMSQASFEDAAALAGCDVEGVACYAKLAETLRVDGLIVGTVAPAGDGSRLALTLDRYEAATATVDPYTAEVPAESFDALRAAYLRSVTQAFIGTSEPPPDVPPDAPPDVPPDQPPPVVAPPVVTPEPSSPQDKAFDLRRVGKVPWIVAGGGVALLAVGSIFYVMAGSKQDEIDSAPTQTPADFDRLRELEDQGETYATIGNVLVIGGTLVAIGGAGWAVWRATRRGAERPAVSIAPVPVRGGVGLTLSVPLP